MIPMVTSSWRFLVSSHPYGLVPILLGLRCLFRGDWSQRMASFTSESDSNIFGRGDAASFVMLIFSVSLRTWIASLRTHEYPRRNAGQTQAGSGSWIMFPGCVSNIFYFRPSVNLLSSPVNGYSEGRWPMADVGVHSYISTIDRSTLSELLFLWIGKNRILSHIMISLGNTIPWLCNMFFSQIGSEL